MKMETKFEISLEAYTSIVSENAKLKALLGRCENILLEMVSAEVNDWEISHLSPEQCKAAKKLNNDWLIQKYSSESAIGIVMDNLPCFTVQQIKNAIAENIRRKIQARVEDIEFFNRLKGKLGDAG